jgi:hypothetical protein
MHELTLMAQEGWSERPFNGSDRLLVAISLHIMRCRQALRHTPVIPSRPVLLSLQVTPRAEWVAAGLVTSPAMFDKRHRTRLDRCLPEARSSLLTEWHVDSTAVLPVKPDTLEWSGLELEPLFAPVVCYFYGAAPAARIIPRYPVLRADTTEIKQALFENPGLAWRRTVWTDDPELARLLVACEHPETLLAPVYGACPEGAATVPPVASEPHTFLLNAFRHHSFFVSMSGPNGFSDLWEFAERVFGGIFGFESCFSTRDATDGAISVKLDSPAISNRLQWRVERGPSEFCISDWQGEHSCRPNYLSTRQAFVAWMFDQF